VLHIPAEIVAQMIAHAERETPRECCGLLAGPTPGIVTHCHELVNEAPNTVEFISESRSMFAAHRAMRELGTQIVAVYHSHPRSPAEPSRLDLERSYADDVACIIVSLAGPAPVVQAWWLAGGRAVGAQLDIVRGERGV
jgi:proteasome lid subunit RPN8/RPN11